MTEASKPVTSKTGEEIPLGTIIHSNLGVFLDVAREAVAKCEQLSARYQRRRTDGQPGLILTPDRFRNSFKQALISIAFSGVYLDTLLRLALIRKLGPKEAEEHEFKTYERKLYIVGVTSEALLTRTKAFRESRNDLMHEEPLIQGFPSKRLGGVAQKEARVGLDLVIQLTVAIEELFQARVR